MTKHRLPFGAVLLVWAAGTLLAVQGCRERPDRFADALTGHLYVPVLPVTFSGTNAPFPADTLAERLFSRTKRYSVTTYYDELSNGLLEIDATVGDWINLDDDKTYYAGRTHHLINALVELLPDSFDFGKFDNDGPDDIPNSGDDDGYVDVLLVVHSALGSECATKVDSSKDNIWSHRSSVFRDSGGLSRGYATKSKRVSMPDSPGRRNPDSIKVNTYIIMGAQGGDDACTPNEPLSIGTLTHELGHVLGLPELYGATSPPGPGIGRWGLMGIGNLQVPSRPVHMTAWAKAQLGWVTEVLIENDTILEISPIVESDTSYVVPIAGTNEHLILANRQPMGADTSLVTRSPWGGVLGKGLLIWRVDSVLMRTHGLDSLSCWKVRAALCRNADSTTRNQVNAGVVQGLFLEVADGSIRSDSLPFDPFDSTVSDPGDPFPGATGYTAFSFASGSSSVVVDQIEQIAEGGAIRARISFGRNLWVPRMALTGAFIGEPYDHLLPAPAGDHVYSWRLSREGLPPGLTLESDGTLRGVPREAGTFAFGATAASDADTRDVAVTLTVNRR